MALWGSMKGKNSSPLQKHVKHPIPHLPLGPLKEDLCLIEGRVTDGIISLGIPTYQVELLRSFEKRSLKIEFLKSGWGQIGLCYMW